MKQKPYRGNSYTFSITTMGDHDTETLHQGVTVTLLMSQQWVAIT